MKEFVQIILNQIDKTRPNKILLGRWYINYCPKKTNFKIDWANEDHCGPCSKYNININNKKYSKR